MAENKQEYQLTVRNDIVPDFAIPLDEARRRIQQLQRFVKDMMKEGVDYGKIPGVDKPSLWKPGAEKLINIFGLDLELIEVDRVEDWDKGFFYYKYRATLRCAKTGRILGICEGSCNSMESKYRWRAIPEWKASDYDKQRAVRIETRRSKGGHEYTVYIVENDDPFSLVNTLQKMGQKRAIIGATLIATRASDIFTQDVEDLPSEVIEGEAREIPPEPPVKQPQRRPANKKRVPDHPWPAEFLKKAFAENVQVAEKRGATGPATDKQAQTLARLLEEIWAGEDDAKFKRYGLLKYLFGGDMDSCKKLSKAQARVLFDWIIEKERDESGGFIIKPYVRAEADACLQACVEELGQMRMESVGDVSDEELEQVSPVSH